MPMSLKCMIDKWLHKGQISQEEYDAVIKKLEGHDKQIRAEVIDELVLKLEADMPSKLDAKERYGYAVALTIVMEQLKGAENESIDT